MDVILDHFRVDLCPLFWRPFHFKAAGGVLRKQTPHPPPHPTWVSCGLHKEMRRTGDAFKEQALVRWKRIKPSQGFNKHQNWIPENASESKLSMSVVNPTISCFIFLQKLESGQSSQKAKSDLLGRDHVLVGAEKRAPYHIPKNENRKSKRSERNPLRSDQRVPRPFPVFLQTVGGETQRNPDQRPPRLLSCFTPYVAEKKKKKQKRRKKYKLGWYPQQLGAEGLGFVSSLRLRLQFFTSGTLPDTWPAPDHPTTSGTCLEPETSTPNRSLRNLP